MKHESNAFTTRTDDGHAAPLSLFGKTFSLTFILLSPLVRFLALNRIEPQPPPLVYSPANSLKSAVEEVHLLYNIFIKGTLFKNPVIYYTARMKCVLNCKTRLGLLLFQPCDRTPQAARLTVSLRL